MGKKILLTSLVFWGAIFIGGSGPLFARTTFDDSTGGTVEGDSQSSTPTQATEETVQTPQIHEAPAPATVNRTSDSSSEAEAEKFFRRSDRRPADSGGNSTSGGSGGSAGPSAPVLPQEHYLAIGIGGFLGSDSYQWGQTPHTSDTGRLMGEVTYRIGSLSSLADWALRADLLGYQLPEGNATQLALSPVLMFPDSGSRFPIYFGLGAGPGVFLSQLSQESFLSFNYQIFAGVRFFNLIDSTGFFAEVGIKNHVLLLSDGQFNGTYLAVGAVFMF